MSFTVFSYNATVLLIPRNPTQPITCAGKCDPTQPNPWMDPTHVHLCGKYRTAQRRVIKGRQMQGRKTKDQTFRLEHAGSEYAELEKERATSH